MCGCLQLVTANSEIRTSLQRARTRAHTQPLIAHSLLVCSYGYDPLGLGKDPAQVETYRAYELIHARWAMLAAAGIVIPEGLQVRIFKFSNLGSSQSLGGKDVHLLLASSTCIVVRRQPH